jgi:hypothetical protein
MTPHRKLPDVDPDVIRRTTDGDPDALYALLRTRASHRRLDRRLESPRLFCSSAGIGTRPP